MAVAALKPSFTLKSRFTAIRSGFFKASRSLGGATQILLKKTRVKREAIQRDRILFNKRNENVRRKDQEELVESSKVGGGIRRIGSIVGESTKGFLGRIMDVVQSLVLGWLVYNLPTIINMSMDLIGRLQKAGSIIGGFVGNIVKIFTGSAKILGAVLTNLVTLDIFDTNKRVRNSFTDLYNTFADLDTQIKDGVKLATTPLGQLPDEEYVAPMGTDYTIQPGASAVSGVSKEALDVIAKYESTSAGGYEAVNQIGIAGGTKTLGYSGPFGNMKQHRGKKLTQMTVAEIMDLQKEKSGMSNSEWIKQGRLHAVGRYQIIGPTLAGLVKRGVIKPTDKFDETTQDIAAMSLLKSGGIGQWVGPSRYATAKEKAIIQRGKTSPLTFSAPGATPSPSGASSNVLANAAASMKGFSTRQGPGGGNIACVWAVNQVFRKAGMRPPWGTSDYVPTAEASMIKAGYRQIPIGQQRPGDLYICHGQWHIGIVLPNGNIISNSSSGSKFSWEAPLSSYQSYYRGPGKFYRIPGAEIAALPGRTGAQIPAETSSLVRSQPAQINRPSLSQPQQLQRSRQGQQIIVVDDRKPITQVSSQPSSGGSGVIALPLDKQKVLNTFIKNHLLLDLSYT